MDTGRDDCTSENLLIGNCTRNREQSANEACGIVMKSVEVLSAFASLLLLYCIDNVSNDPRWSDLLGKMFDSVTVRDPFRKT